MDSSKYVIPKLPTTQNVLDDILDPSVLQSDKEYKIIQMDGILNDAYRCYCSINKLRRDIHQQNDLNAKLEDLNKELAINIENMKKQR